MKLERPLLFLDTETTGVDPAVDRIVELGVSILHPDGTVKPKGWSVRFNPGIPIPQEAIDCHHITNEMVKDCKPFLAYAPTIHRRLQGKDLAGYNLRRLDLPLLDQEFRRCGLSLDLTGVRVIDVQAIYFKKEPRSLSDCIKRYCGREHEDAHGAGPDADGTLDALMGQLNEYEDLRDLDLDALETFATMGDHKPADIAGKLYRDLEGGLRFNFGKQKDQLVRDRVGYAEWMLKPDKNFPGSTLDEIRKELNILGGG